MKSVQSEALRSGLDSNFRVGRTVAAWAVWAAVGGAGVTASPSGGGSEPAGPSAMNAPVVTLQDRVNHELGLVESSVQSLAFEAEPGEAFDVQVELGEAAYVLHLIPHSIRAEGFELRAQIEDGSIIPMPTPVSRTLRGTVEGAPGVLVAGSILEDGLYATVLFSAGERYWIEPIGEQLGGDPSMHVIYRNEDVISAGASCGNEVMERTKSDVPLAGIEEGGDDTICLAELANDADVEYFEDFDSVAETEDHIEMIINASNLQYESEVGISHVITVTIVRTAEPDPYSTSDSGDLLCQFINEWTNNQPDIPRDVAQLFTGKELSGTVIGQAAEIGSICESDGCSSFPCFCSSPGSYCIVQSNFSGFFSCQTDLTTHELGHLWGASHCSCSSFTMNPVITCANEFHPTETIPDIIAYRNTRPCIDCITGLAFDFPNGLPELVSPSGGTTVLVEITEQIFQPQPGTAVIHFMTDGGSSAAGIPQAQPDIYIATFPAFECADEIRYYFTSLTTEGTISSMPAGAPLFTFSTIAGFDAAQTFHDDFETSQGWTVLNSPTLTDGAWDRGVPVGGGDRGDPPTDADGSGQCFLTDNEDDNSDVDGGSTTLISPIMDASQGNPVISYWRWFSNDFGDNPFDEEFVVDISDNGGATWVNLETVGPAGDEVSGGWFYRQFLITDFGLEANNNFRIRFIADDSGPEGSVVEAGVDGVRLRSIDCEDDSCPADLVADGTIGFADLLTLLAAWGPCEACAEDLDGNDAVGFSDLLLLLAAFGPCL